MYANVALTVDDRTAWISLNRPARNLIDAPTTRSLATSFQDCLANEQVDAVVFIGEGDAFCGGADAAAIRETDSAPEFATAIVDLFVSIQSSPKPVIAAINGDALAGGFGLACVADIVVAQHSARLGTIEASLGSWPMIAQVPASRRVPEKALLTNVLTGVPFSAERAYQLGIVDELVTNLDELQKTVSEFARKIVGGGTSVRKGRRLLRELSDIPFEQALNLGAKEFVSMMTT